jgi:hypothetical protein
MAVDWEEFPCRRQRADSSANELARMTIRIAKLAAFIETPGQ